MVNASLDDANAAAAATFFFTTDGKTFVPPFNCYIRNRANAERLPNSSMYLFKRPSSWAGRDFTDAVLNVGGSSEGGGGSTDNEVAL
jgi:hypothetical protein